MRKVMLCAGLLALLLVGTANAATEEAKQTAIDNGLAWLEANKIVVGPEVHWAYGSPDGDLATTASAALAFIEEGYLPGDGSMYDATITGAVLYIFNRATLDARFGPEVVGYPRYAEDYDNDGIYDDGNDQALYFEPGLMERRVYTTGLCTPVVHALGNAFGLNTVITVGSAAINGKTYAQAMQDIVDWFAWGQVEPSQASRGGWRYDANWGGADNSTAQWGSLPLLYAQAWGLGVPQFVYNELNLWVNYIQDPVSGGSGYDVSWNLISISKTGGLLLELAALNAPVGDPRVVKALAYINAHWNEAPSGAWYGNLGHSYAMWALYKGLQVYGFLVPFDCGPENIMVGVGVPNAPGGFNICFNAAPATSAAGDWYSHYCDFLCGYQNPDGSWPGYEYWYGPLAVGWYINILNAVEIPVGPIEVAFDIKPTSCPNPFNMKIFDLIEDPIGDDKGHGNGNDKKKEHPVKGGVLPVAILGTGNFDVTTIDPETILLEGIAPVRWCLEDVATPYDGAEECGCTRLGPDGYMDLTLKFVKAEVAAFLGIDVVNNQVIPLTIAGNLYDGREFEGVDCIRIVDREVEQPMPLTDGDPILGAAVPNPFNPMTRISYTIPDAGYVELSVYDVRGMLVDRLVARVENAGEHFVEWNATGHASGTYFYRLKAGAYTATRKMLLVK
jgi:hypothetical protein